MCLKKNEENEVKVTFLHPPGPAPSFSFPKTVDVLWIPSTDVLCKANPTTPTGRVYMLPDEEKLKIAEIYNNLNC